MKLAELSSSLASEREAKEAAESEKRLVQIELEAKQRRLGDMADAAQAAAADAVAARLEANERYEALAAQLEAERAARAALERQMDEAAVQLSAANTRYQEALVQLHSERTRATQFEVRPVGAGAGWGWRAGSKGAGLSRSPLAEPDTHPRRPPAPCACAARGHRGQAPAGHS